MSNRIWSRLMVGLLILACATSVRAEDDVRTVWRHKNGTFANNKGKEWLEKYGQKEWHYVETVQGRVR